MRVHFLQMALNHKLSHCEDAPSDVVSSQNVLVEGIKIRRDLESPRLVKQLI